MKFSDEHRKKLSIATIKGWQTFENYGMRNKHHSLKTRQAISIKKKEWFRQHPTPTGWKHSDETREKIKQVLKRRFPNGRPINSGCFKKGNHNDYEFKKGHVVTEEIRKKISDSSKGRKHSHESIKKFIQKVKGRKYPKEQFPNWGFRANRLEFTLPVKDTKIEVKIQNYLKLLHIEFKTHYYISEINHGYQCDILIPTAKLVIECDGCYWHGCPTCNRKINEYQNQQIKEDAIRTKELNEIGYKIIRLWEHDIKKISLNEFERIVK